MIGFNLPHGMPFFELFGVIIKILYHKKRKIDKR